MLNWMPIVYYVYAALLLGGGMMGMKVAGSTKSVVGASIFALVAVAAGVLTRSNPRAGLILGLLDALAVTALFVYRYMDTRKPMPAFGSIGLSVVVLVLTVAAFSALKRPAGEG